MAGQPKLGLMLRQRLALTPTLRTSLALLRLPTMELFDAIEREAADNPFLIVEDLRPTAAEAAGTSRAAFDRAMELVPSEPTLVEDLRHQLAAMTLPTDVRAVAYYLVGDLRDDGYLDTPPDEVAQALGVDPDLVLAALAAVQQCEPAGIGARGLAECLELQLRDRGVAADLAARMIGQLDLFAAENWPRLGRLLGLAAKDLPPLAAIVRTLTPRPAPDRTRIAAPLLPDLVLERGNDGATRVVLGVLAMPPVRLNTDLLRMAVAAPDEPFVAERRVRADALIRALQFRGETLLRIGEWIAVNQHRFFALGPEHLVPVSRATVAGALGLHGSTIGRAVAGKALEAGGRLYPLSMFFSQGLVTGAGGVVSALAVQGQIARMVSAEPVDAPLSDAAICQMLQSEGVDIARRTVAKYRVCMRIPPSFARRRRSVTPSQAQTGQGTAGPSI